MCLAWSDFTLFSANSKGQIICWDVEKRSVKHTFIGHSGIVMDLCVINVPKSSTSGFPPRILASCSVDHSIRLWDFGCHAELQVLHGHTKEVMCIAFSDHSELLVSGGADPILLVWSLDCGQPLQRIYVENPDALSACCTSRSPSGRARVF